MCSEKFYQYMMMFRLFADESWLKESRSEGLPALCLPDFPQVHVLRFLKFCYEIVFINCPAEPEVSWLSIKIVNTVYLQTAKNTSTS